MRAGKLAFTLGALILTGSITAGEKDSALVDQRSGPPVFRQVNSEFCSTPNVTIPNQSGVGIDDTLIVRGAGNVADLDVVLQVAHTWVGDLRFTLTNDQTGTAAVILDRPGHPDTAFGCSGNDIDATLSDQGSPSVEDVCNPQTPAIGPGPYSPFPDALAVFSGESADGSWTLNSDDLAGQDSGALIQWCLVFSESEPVPAIELRGAIALVACLMTLIALRWRHSLSA